MRPSKPVAFQKREEFRARTRPTFFWPQFIAISALFKRIKPPKQEDAFGYEYWLKVVYETAATFAADNDRFNRKAFLNACGAPPDEEVK
jgi:hypothetical protein